MRHRFFVTGIGTEVGKTITAAVLTEALEADYWKPVQAGDLHNSDTHRIKSLISNQRSFFHPNSYALQTPMSPHAAAERDGIQIRVKEIEEPETENHLIIEGAGGVLVPLNDKETILDLIKPSYNVIIVSRHYLGSINHTLLTIEALKNKGLNCFGIIFNGNENPSTEEVISKMSGVPVLGRIDQEPFFDKNVVLEYAEHFREKLNSRKNN